MDNAATKAFLEVKSKLGLIQNNVNELKAKFSAVNKAFVESVSVNASLQAKIEALEEDNSMLNNAVKQGLMRRQQNQYVAGGRSRNIGSNATSKKGDDLRRALITDEDEGISVDLDNIFQSTSALAAIMNWVFQLIPLREDIRRIQARHGASVASYFVFSRFIFLQFTFLAILMLGFLMYHLYHMLVVRDPASNLWRSATPSSSYIPKFLLYHSYSPSEAVVYTWMVVVCTVILTVTIVEKVLREDRLGKELSAAESEDDHPFSRDVLCAWDLSLVTHVDAENLQGTIGNGLLQKLQEMRQKGIRRSRTYLQVMKLYAVRFVGFVCYAVWQVLAFAIIIVLTIYHEQVFRSIPLLTGLASYSSILVNLSLNALGSVTPLVLEFITELEQWDSAQVEMNIKLFRVFLSNQLNVLLFVLSYILLADPYLFSTNDYIHQIRQNVESSYDPKEFNCRFDAVEYQLLLLSITTMVGNWVGTVFDGMSPYLYQRLWKKKEVERKRFGIVASMVNLLNFVMIEMLRVPFAPQTLVFTPVFLYLSLKIEGWVVLNYCNKPTRPWKAQKAGVVFTFFYFMSFMLVGLPVVIYFFVSKTFPKNCDIQVRFLGMTGSVLFLIVG